MLTPNRARYNLRAAKVRDTRMTRLGPALDIEKSNRPKNDTNSTYYEQRRLAGSSGAAA